MWRALVGVYVDGVLTERNEHQVNGPNPTKMMRDICMLYPGYKPTQPQPDRMGGYSLRGNKP